MIMMIEQDTPYAYLLKYMGNLTFDNIRNHVVTSIRKTMPQSLQEILYEELNRGLRILDDESQMDIYLYAFGKMHQAKLNHAFIHLPKIFLEQHEINIIDYGCGFGLDLMCYADYFRDNDYTQQVKTITLIEPSEICLKRAALHASMFFPDADIVTVNKTFDELDETDIYCDQDTPTLHILSNVLDILDFDIKKFAELIYGQTKGYNQFVCVGPYFNNSEKDGRMEQFCSLLNGENYYSKSFDKYEFDEQNAWTANVLCFVVRKAHVNNLSTKVTKAEIVKGVEDEYGVVYSKDGKKLLKCRNRELITYSIKHGTKLICDSAFEGFWKSQSICIPDSVTMIGKLSFCGCQSIKIITIPNSVTMIGDNAFENCICLQKVNFSDAITNIGNRIFVFCESLQHVTIPSSVIEIGTNPFIGCRNVELKSCSSRFIVKKGFLTDNQSEIISFVGKEEKVIIPNTVNTIGEFAFCGCKTIRQIYIPNSLTMVRKGAFASSSLQRINLPETITSIEEYVFCFCDSLKQITIPKSVTQLGNNAFYCCKSIQQIHIPDSVTKIGDGVFYQCESLQQINLPGSISKIGYNAFWGCGSLQIISIPQGSIEKFKKMLDENLWDKLVEE